MPEFGVAARTRQGQFRDASPSISQLAREPADDKGQRHPHLLALGFEEENLYPPLRGPGGAIAFFRDRGIQWWKSARSDDDFSMEGPTRNLASSQVGCLNFLLPLAQSAILANALLDGLDRDKKDVVPITYSNQGVSLTSLVEFEWVGLGTTLEGFPSKVRGANATSADALILADLSSGGRRAYLLEWKYVEEYKSGEYRGNGPRGVTRRMRYSGRFDSPSSPFRGGCPFEAWLYEPFYQIMRLLLLGQKMVDEREFGITEAVVAVVCPQENTAYRNRITSADLQARYPRAANVADVVQSSLRDPSRFRLKSQDALLRAVARPSTAGLHDWLMYHRERYGWVEGSASAQHQ
jgi:hypothetical protein